MLQKGNSPSGNTKACSGHSFIYCSVWCKLAFRNAFRHQFSRDCQVNEKTKGLDYKNNNHHLGRHICSVLFDTACGVFRKMFSTFYYKLPLIDGESEKVGLCLKSYNLRRRIKKICCSLFYNIHL